MRSCAVNDYSFKNVATLLQSFQVSTLDDEYGLHPASLANDGNRATNYHVSVGSCAASDVLETNPWWAVDLGIRTLVAYVEFTNRDDSEGISSTHAFSC